MGYEDAKADVKKTMREADEKAKETWRRADGEESVSDKVANLGDDIRNERPRQPRECLVRRLASARAAGIGPAAEAVEEREAHRRGRNQRERHEDPVRPAD